MAPAVLVEDRVEAARLRLTDEQVREVMECNVARWLARKRRQRFDRERPHQAKRLNSLTELRERFARER